MPNSTEVWRLSLALLLLPVVAAAQVPSFPPDEAWTTVTKGAPCTTLFDAPLDSATGTGTGARDNVNTDEAAAQIFADEGFVYFRLRVDTSPNAPGWDQFGWGCQLSTDGNNFDYEAMVWLDGQGGAVDTNAVVRIGPAPANADSPGDITTAMDPSYAAATHARAVSDGSADFFVDFAVPRDRLGFSCPPATATLVCGSHSNGTGVLTTGSSGDIIGVGKTDDPTWAQAASCPMVFPGRCGAGQLCNLQDECVDCLGEDDCSPEQTCSNGICVGCVVNTDCDLPASPTCTLGVCGPCTSDAECLDDDPALPACHEETGQCVECRDDADCADNGANDVCDLASSTCGECRTNDDCVNPTPVCDLSGDVNVCIAGSTTTTSVTIPESTTTVTSTTSTTSLPFVGGDHFSCYKMKDLQNPPFTPQIGVSLVDQLAATTVDVKKPALLCIPTSKNGSAIDDPNRHLCCYKIKGPKLAEPVGAEVADQFGNLQVQVKKAGLLCQPCSKTLLP